MPLPPDHAARLARARLALDGLSVGDAFGDRFFRWPPELISEVRATRKMVERYWRYTDDTEMALALYDVLAAHGHVDQDALAAAFAARYAADDRRGYGSGAHALLMQLCAGHPWQTASPALFDGTGSLGNGGAMRVAPVAAYFAQDDDATIVEQARRSAEVTHAHPEGQAGAIATALATAWAWRHRGQSGPAAARDFFDYVLAHTPDTLTRDTIDRAATMQTPDVQTAARRFGSGERVTAPDTVPFCLWVAARHLDSYPESLWETVQVYGDIDTNCAIVGGITSLSATTDPIPPDWLTAREPLHFTNAP
jgi:ADP-ribosylglycohydrolase